MRSDSNGDLVVVESNSNVIDIVYYDNNGVHVQQIASISNARLGMTFHNGYLYASSDTTVYRWAYTPGARTNLGQPQLVLVNMPAGGAHPARNLVFFQ